MIWNVLVLSQCEGSEWKHTEATSYLKIAVGISSETIDIYLRFFGCEEKIDSLPFLDVSIQKRDSSVAIFLPSRKVQLKLSNTDAADSMCAKASYMQMMRILSNGLSDITLRHTKPKKTLF